MKLLQFTLSTCFLFLFAFAANAAADVNFAPAIGNEATASAAENLAQTLQAYQSFKAEKKTMTRQERRTTRKTLKNDLKTAVKDFEEASDIDLAALIIITILLPPLGMYLYEGSATSRFWLSLILTLLFYLPGLIYTLIVILE